MKKKKNIRKKYEYEHIVSYNKMEFYKGKETLGLEEKNINDILKNQMKNRRNIHIGTFIKRQKEKFEKEEIKERLKNLK